MNDPRPGFMFNVVEFWSSERVDAMDAAAVGVYLFLLSRQWQNGSIPKDSDELQRMCRRLSVADWASTWAAVEPCFPLGDDGRRRNERLERERDEADRKSSQASGAIKERWRRYHAEQEKAAQERRTANYGTDEANKDLSTENVDRDTGEIRTYNGRSSTDLPRARGTGTGTGKRQGEENQSPLTPLAGGTATPEAELQRAPEPKPAPKARAKRDTQQAIAAVIDEPEFLAVDSHEMRSAWASWLAHRTAIGKPLKTAASARQNLRRAVEHGPTAWIAAAAEAVANEWIGMFPERHTATTSPGAGPPRTAADRREAQVMRSIGFMYEVAAQEQADALREASA